MFGAVCVSRSASATNASTAVGVKLSLVSMTVTGWYFSRSRCACVDAAADPEKATRQARVAPRSATPSQGTHVVLLTVGIRDAAANAAWDEATSALGSHA